MSGSLPAFQCAADLGPSPSREAELEDLCSRLAAENEQLRDAADQPVQPARPAQAGIKPEERQALIQLLSDLGRRIEDLERLTAKQSKEIEDLKDVNNRLEISALNVKDLAKERIGELLKEIVDIRKEAIVDKNDVKDLNEQVAELQDLINQHAEAINKIWQSSKKAREPSGKKSLARIERIKEILKSGPRTYKDLERLLNISPKEMNRLVSMLDTRSYEIFFRAGDDRQKVLRLRAWNAQQSKPLTSNVKYSSEGPCKLP